MISFREFRSLVNREVRQLKHDGQTNEIKLMQRGLRMALRIAEELHRATQAIGKAEGE